jgi:hypothetical protein
VTLREVAPARARDWMVTTLGLESLDPGAFDPVTLNREPTRWPG